MNVHHLESADHPLLADYIGLTDAALRVVAEPQAGLYIAESLTILERALERGHVPRSILTSDKWLPALETLLSRFPHARDTPVLWGSPELLESVTGFVVHRGTLASMVRPELPSLESIIVGATRLIVLEDIVDHTNVGALFRSVAGIGADGVIVTPRCADPLYRRSVRVSMGSVLQVPWTRSGEIADLVATLHRHRFEVVGLALGDDSVSLDDYLDRAPEKVALVLGSEGHGLQRGTLQLCDSLVEIPMHHGVDSLNVAAAGAVALWALRPNRRH